MKRFQRLLAAGCAAALLTAGAAAIAPVAHAGLPTTVDPTIPDGDADSLRDVLENQVSDGDTVALEAGATYVLDECEDGQIVIGASVTIEGNGATIQQTCIDRVLDVKDPVTINNTTVTGGQRSGDGGGIYVDADVDAGELVLQGSTVTGNEATGNGGGIYGEGPVTVVDSTISDNASVGGDDGGGIYSAAGLWIFRSTLSGNCAEDDGGAISGEEDDVMLVNSTVTGNVSDDQGAIAMDLGELVVVYSTIASNTLEDDVDCGEIDEHALPDESLEADPEDVGTADTDEPSNIGVGDGGVRIFGSVVAMPLGNVNGSVPAFNCGEGGGEGAGPVVSSGYNYSDDDTCGLTDATDVEDGADPQLGALGANGGPTATMLPVTTSPLVNAIPTAACAGGDALAGEAITTDQRSLVRPDVVNQRCDIGAVEIQTEAIALEPNFTG